MTKAKRGWHYGSHVILALALLLIFGIYMQMKNKQWSNLVLVNQDLTSQLRTTSKELKTDREILIHTIMKLQFRLDPYLVEAYANAIMESSKRWKLHPNLIACVIFRESSFNPVAVSRAGAEGPMQIILKYHMDKVQRRGWTKQEALYLAQNIDLGSEIIREYFDAKGNLQKALTKYVGDTSNKHLDYVSDILQMFAESLNKTDQISYKEMIMKHEKESEVDDVIPTEVPVDIPAIVDEIVETVKSDDPVKTIKPSKTKKVIK